MSKKKIKVKVKKRKLNVKKIILFTTMIILITILLIKIFKMPTKNIYIIGNNILSDKEIIEISKLDSYPYFLTTTSSSIIKKLKNNNYIKEVKIKKKLPGKIYVYVIEKRILCIYGNKLLLEDSTIVENKNNNLSYPILISDINEIKDKFILKLSLVDNSILLKISEIEYTPNDVDSERFTLKMNDGNLVYITLNKIEKINKYNSIYSSLDGKKGIIYLDSGDYVEVKEEY